MTKIYSKLFLAVITVLGLNAQAQCAGCTTNITGLNTGNHIITSGQTLCVASTGTMTGLITISAGGTLCNQGQINSTNLWVAGGTFYNFGSIDTYSVLVSAAGTFINNSTAFIDSLMITNPNSNYTNNGTQYTTAFTTSDHASTVNTGQIMVYNMWDSLATFHNIGSISVTHDFGNAYTSTFTNDGDLFVTNDFGNSYSSTFNNNMYMKVYHDFYNATSATFRPNCMMEVGHDWFNSAYVYGPTSGCGGFNVTAGTYNSGVIGSTGVPVDICDAGHPTFGLDGPGGTIHASTTYCTCNNTCQLTVGIKEVTKESTSLITTIFPNPATSNLSIALKNNDNEILTIEVRDMMGKTVMTISYKATVGDNQAVLNVANLAQGTYILSVTDSHQLQTKRLFNITK